MDQVKFYKILVIILIIVNLGTLGMIWFTHFRQSSDKRFPSAGNHFLRELNLTPEQQKAFRAHRAMHMNQLRQLQAEDRLLHERFFNLSLSESPDSIALNHKLDSILFLRKKMELLIFDHFNTLNSMLDKKQQAIFRANFKYSLNKVIPLPKPPGDLPPPPAPAPPEPIHE